MKFYREKWQYLRLKHALSGNNGKLDTGDIKISEFEDIAIKIFKKKK